MRRYGADKSHGPTGGPLLLSQQTKQKRSGIWWVFGAVYGFMLTGLKALVSLLSFGKAGGAVLSMGVAVAFYAWLYQWEFAVGIVLMVLIHEMGHVLAAKRKGIAASAPFFIPFVGALILLKRNPRDAATEAYIAYGGPLLGTAGAVLFFLAGWLTGHPVLHVIAYIGFVLNLINLLPVHPLDGGRIASTVSRWLWAVGLVVGILVVIRLHSLLLFLVWLLFVWDWVYRYLKKRSNAAPFSIWGSIEVPYDAIPASDWMITGAHEMKGMLPYTTYSDLTERQWVELHWEFADTVKRVEMQEQGLIRCVQALRVEPRWKDEPKCLVLRYQIDYEPYENEDYFNIPSSVRWKFALAYGGLALFLYGMMLAVQWQLGHIGRV